jgi:multiple sugar transport system substrate-binding protein
VTTSIRRSAASRSRRLAFGGVAAAAALVLAACGSSGGGSTTSSAAPSSTEEPSGTIKVWAQQGQPGEVKAVQDAVAEFNSSQSKIKVELTLLPQATYGQTIATTPVDKLPDAFEFDGETLGALVYAQKLAPLEGVVSQEALDAQLPSLKALGTYPGDGKRYSVSQYDSGLGLWGNKALLSAAGVTDIPTTIDAAWSAQEFYDVVTKVAGTLKGGKGLDIKENYAGTWPGYAFTPIVNGAGFPLVNDGSANGNLNAPAVATALTDFSKMRALTDPNTDDKAFTGKRVALSWCGHWCYPDYSKALGDDLVLIPLPNFGIGTKSGQGSHSWAASAGSQNLPAAGKFLDFVVADAQITAVTDANGAVPGTESAIAASANYKQGGPLALYADQLAKSCGSNPPTQDCVTVPRTISPAWPVINDKYSQAFWNIWKGADAQAELDKAAKAIDLDYADNDGYQS